jgi:hypothetical protein
VKCVLLESSQGSSQPSSAMSALWTRTQKRGVMSVSVMRDTLGCMKHARHATQGSTRHRRDLQNVLIVRQASSPIRWQPSIVPPAATTRTRRREVTSVSVIRVLAASQACCAQPVLRESSKPCPEGSRAKIVTLARTRQQRVHHTAPRVLPTQIPFQEVWRAVAM